MCDCKWQKIETAPKDFVTEFDGWNGERVPSVSWAHPEYSPKGHCAWCVSEYENHNGWINTEVKNLTHWMPLPAAPEATASEPAGWKLVPVEPTPQMLDAGQDVEDLYRRGTPDTWGKVYRAMLAAAPEATASEPAGCTWTQQDDEHMPGTWASSCGELWSFNDGGPKENRVSYCHHCGGKVNLTAAPEATK
jgi:hypothetical protein